MKFWESIIIVFCILIVSGCGNKEPNGIFLRGRVSFTYPSDWSITEQGELGEVGGYYLAAEKEGVEASGILTLTWVNGDLEDSREYIDSLQKGFEEQKLINGIKFQSVRDNTFNGIKALSCDFIYKSLGVNYRGVIYVFVRGQQIYSIIKQEDIGDISQNTNGFDLIEETFRVE